MQREDIRQYARVRYRDGRPSGTWTVQDVSDAPIVLADAEGNRRSAWPDELVPEVGAGESLPIEPEQPHIDPIENAASSPDWQDRVHDRVALESRMAEMLSAACRIFDEQFPSAGFGVAQFPSAGFGVALQPVATLAAAMLQASYIAEQVAVSRQILECQLRIERGDK